jgi:hypothetical protein
MAGMVLGCGIAQAYVVVNINSAGAYAQFGSDLNAGWTDPNVADGSLVQVIWSPDSTLSAPNTDGTVDSTERLLYTSASGTITQYGYAGYINDPKNNTTPNFSTRLEKPGDIDNTTWNSGYVYLRVFDDSAGNIGIGDHYVSGSKAGGVGTGVQVSTMAVDPTFPSQVTDLDMTTSSSAQNSRVAMDSTVAAIPEPGTIMLMALGLVTLAGTRKFRK